MGVVELGLATGGASELVGEALRETAEDVVFAVTDWDVFVFGGRGYDFEEAAYFCFAV